VFNQEARPHDQAQQKEVNQAAFESRSRNVLRQDRAGIIIYRILQVAMLRNHGFRVKTVRAEVFDFLRKTQKE
jgi:hypothetical protein